MRLTPIDIQQHEFPSKLRGFERGEVRNFLTIVAEQLAELIRENNDLRAELRRYKRELDDHRDREGSLREAMLTAQRAIEDIREQAQKEAQLVVSEAELRAEKIVHSAHARVTKTTEEIADLRRQRARMLAEIRGVLVTHTKLLDVHEQDGASHEEGTVTVLDRLRVPKPPSASDLAPLEAQLQR